MIEKPDSMRLLIACEDLAKFLEDRDVVSEQPHYLEKFINLLFTGETPKMALVIIKHQAL